MDYIQLFGRGNLLGSALGATAQDVGRRLQTWNPDDLLDTSDEDIIERLVEQGSVHCPLLLPDKAAMLKPTEITQEYVDFGERRTRRVTRMVLAVPFEGEQKVFTLRADTSSNNPPQVLRLQDRELHLAIDDPPEDGAQIKAQFDDQIAKIEEYLGWSRTQIERHNEHVRNEVPKLVAERREQLLATRKLQADTGYPIRGQRDSDPR
ncbi:MAG: hypothetical protein WA622_12770 [Mycobacterium sp.]|uniref:hypothetical protein n=1 Tax=Mycobacterium sp. TaxID=1785 RepID=UPI003C934685